MLIYERLRMTQSEFLEKFTSVLHKCEWSYENNLIKGVIKRGNDRGVKVNPVTIVARNFGYGKFPATQYGTMRAARKLGITDELALAILSSSNRGHAQIIRGKILLLLGSCV